MEDESGGWGSKFVRSYLDLRAKSSDYLQIVILYIENSFILQRIFSSCGLKCNNIISI